MRSVEEIGAELARTALCPKLQENKDCLKYPTCSACPAVNEGFKDKLNVELRAALTDGIPLEAVEEWAKAYKGGRAVVLPCRVGDTVYVITYCENVMMNIDDDWETGTGARECPFENDCPFEDCDDGNQRIFETTCTGFYWDEDRRDVFFEHLNAEFYLSDFSKTVFLTRSEAEAALTKPQ